jgi:phage-related protein
MKRSEISELEVEVQQIRKRYKDLVNQLRNNDDGN